MMHKHAQLIMGTWPIYKKALPTIDLNKKNLSFDKISPRDFYFCPFFSICTCHIIPSTTSPAIKSPCFKVKSISYEMKKNIDTIFQENVFENDGCRAKCMFVLPTMCEMGIFCYEFHNSQSLFKHVPLIMPVI